MQNGERIDSLAGCYPPDGNLLLLNAFDQFVVSRSHRITSQPEFADFEVFDDGEQTVHVVVMRVRQNNRIQPPDSPPEQIRRYHALADREGAFVPQVEKSPGSDAPAIDQHSITGRKFDQRGIALPDVEKGHGY